MKIVSSRQRRLLEGRRRKDKLSGLTNILTKLIMPAVRELLKSDIPSDLSKDIAIDKKMVKKVVQNRTAKRLADFISGIELFYEPDGGAGGWNADDRFIGINLAPIGSKVTEYGRQSLSYVIRHEIEHALDQMELRLFKDGPSAGKDLDSRYQYYSSPSEMAAVVQELVRNHYYTHVPIEDLIENDPGLSSLKEHPHYSDLIQRYLAKAKEIGLQKSGLTKRQMKSYRTVKQQ